MEENSSDEDFKFSTAKSELLDIVTQANLTSHDKRGQADNDTRKAWFAERKELDHRLESLLNDMENIWLGGFKGLFNSTCTPDKSLAKFSSNLLLILSKYLPSRQKQPVSKDRVELHSHVLELFLALDHPDREELEDVVTDLLYFVVDILQFNGETNAYDEIDLDAMLVDTMDALRQHHGSPTTAPDEDTGHVILILDKELQCFPWESIPYLRQRAVSRMPSLSAIGDRIKAMRTQR